MKKFITRHAENIKGTLTCFDRLVFHGHLPINYTKKMEWFLRSKKLSLEGFGRFVQTQSHQLRLAAEALAAKEGRPCIYLNSFRRKERYAHSIAEKDGITEGLVCILRTTETCRSFSLRKTKYGLRLASTRRRCLHLYFYFIDPQLGWLHIRLQTWFPFLIQIGINGHEVLAKQMDRHRIAYTRLENAFLAIEDFKRAQRFADGLVKRNWPSILDQLAKRVNPLLKGVLRGLHYYWVTDQSELATDIVFKNNTALDGLYSKLVRHSTLCFSAEDILGFLGRKLHGLFAGEVFNDCRVRRWGVRVKHRIKKNWIKMYDKAGCILRVETVINNPCDFRVRRFTRKRDGRRVKGWAALPKGVGYLHRYREISLSANRRYLDALAVIEDPSEAYGQIHILCAPARLRGTRHRGLNPLGADDRALFRAVLRGEHLIRGFRNGDILHQLYARVPDDPLARRRLSARIRRKLLNLRAHKLLAKIPRTRRYRVTERGYQLMSASLFYCDLDLPQRLITPAA